MNSTLVFLRNKPDELEELSKSIQNTGLAQYSFLFAPATLETKDGMTTKAIQEERLNLTNIYDVFL